MTELEQKLRELLGPQGIQELEIEEAVKLLHEAYQLGSDEADAYWNR